MGVVSGATVETSLHDGSDQRGVLLGRGRTRDTRMTRDGNCTQLQTCVLWLRPAGPSQRATSRSCATLSFVQQRNAKHSLHCRPVDEFGHFQCMHGITGPVPNLRDRCSHGKRPRNQVYAGRGFIAGPEARRNIGGVRRLQCLRLVTKEYRNQIATMKSVSTTCN